MKDLHDQITNVFTGYYVGVSFLMQQIWKIIFEIWGRITVVSIWCVRSHAHTPACNKLHVPLLSMTLIVWDIEMKKKKQRSKASNWIIDHFSLIFVILLFTWMLYFHALYNFRIKENSKFWVNTIISLICSKHCLSEPRQSNVSNPEAYSEPCQTSKMGCFVIIVNG